jgi:hypothetical protein
MAGLLRRWYDGLLPPRSGFETTSLSIAQRTRYHVSYEAARTRFDGALLLAGAGKLVPALLLFGAGFVILTRARLAGANLAPSVDRPVLEYLAETLEAEHPEWARVLRDALPAFSHDELTADGLDRRELRLRVGELAEVAENLLRLMAPETSKERMHRRLARNVLVGVVVLAALAVIVMTAVSPENIALHKRSTSSSAEFHTSPAGVVDGHAYEPLGFHSAEENSPWLRIDLGRPFDLTRVRVFGRHDCCFEQSIPLAVETSMDGDKFTVVATRTEAFDQIDPWEINLDSPRARFLRVRHLGRGLLVLAEVQAFGNAVP